MIANNLIQLIGIIIQVLAGVFTVMKGLQYFFESEVKKRELKLKEVVDLAHAGVELARNNTLSASQVAGILKNYTDLVTEIARMKQDNNLKTEDITKTISRIELLVQGQIDTFSEFLMQNFKQ